MNRIDHDERVNASFVLDGGCRNYDSSTHEKRRLDWASARATDYRVV